MFANCSYVAIRDEVIAERDAFRSACDTTRERNCTKECLEFTETLTSKYPNCLRRVSIKKVGFFPATYSTCILFSQLPHCFSPITQYNVSKISHCIWNIILIPHILEIIGLFNTTLISSISALLPLKDCYNNTVMEGLSNSRVAPLTHQASL